MDWLTDERLFAGGMAVAAVSLVGIILNFFISHRQKKVLERKMNEEYGEEDEI